VDPYKLHLGGDMTWSEEKQAYVQTLWDGREVVVLTKRQIDGLEVTQGTIQHRPQPAPDLVHTEDAKPGS
jgi:hypothetical protein